MPSTTIRVSLETRNALHSLAKAQGRSIQEITEAAVEVYRRQALLEAANRAYAALSTGDKARRSWEQELSIWNEALTDGLEPE